MILEKKEGVQKAVFEEMAYLLKKSEKMVSNHGRSKEPPGVKVPKLGILFLVPGTVHTYVEVGIGVKMVPE